MKRQLIGTPRRMTESAVLISTPVEIASVEELTPRFRRVVVRGEGLRAYEPLPGDVLRLMIPPPGTGAAVMASFGEDGFPYWPDEALRPALRTYAVRAADPARGELSFDVGCLGGPMNWIDAAQPDDRFHIVGMRHGMTLTLGGGLVVLVADASAVPAAAAIIESLEPATKVVLYAEVPTPTEQVLVPPAANVAAHWAVGTSSAGSDSPLERLVRSHPVPAGATVARVCAEVGVARAVRAHLLDTCQLEPGRLLTLGHWQSGLSADERDAQLLPRYEAASAAGHDLRDLDVLEALELDLPLPAHLDHPITKES